MDEQNVRASMTEEQRRKLQEQLLGTQNRQNDIPKQESTTPVNGNATATPLQQQSQMGGGVASKTVSQQPQRRPSAQEQMRQRMMAEKGAKSATGSQQVVLQQTDNYQPQQEGKKPIEKPTGNSTSDSQQTSQQATSTIINTTVDNSDEKPKLNKSTIFIGVACVMAVLLVAFFLFGGNEKDKPEEGQTDGEEVVVDEEGLEWLDPVNEEVFVYSPDEAASLRAAGYTGDEIEEFQRNGIPYEDLIEEAEAARDAWVQEAVAPLYDTASEEYKHYVSQTWLTLPKRTDASEWTTIGAYYNERKNLDYEKIDVYGNQLFIKVYLDDADHESWFFLNVTPEEWNKLNDSGNVIVNYTYCTHLVGDDYLEAVEDMDNIYITDASLEIIEQEE